MASSPGPSCSEIFVNDYCWRFLKLFTILDVCRNIWIHDEMNGSVVDRWAFFVTTVMVLGVGASSEGIAAKPTGTTGPVAEFSLTSPKYGMIDHVSYHS